MATMLLSPSSVRPGDTVKVWDRKVKVDKIRISGRKMIFTQYGVDPIVINTGQIRQVEVTKG